MSTARTHGNKHSSEYMDRLIREQKIERRIVREQRDLYATTSAQSGGEDDYFATTITRSEPAATPAALPHRIALAASPVVPNRGLAAVTATLERFIARRSNTDFCYLAAFLLSIIPLSTALNPDGAIVNYTLQPPVFQLPRVADAAPPLYATARLVAAPRDKQEPQNFQAVSTKSYVVQSGQTVSELAELHNISMGTLISFNQINNARTLQAGSVYAIPDREGILYTVQAGENIEQIAEQHGVSVNTILDVNDLSSAFLESSQQLFLPGAALSDFDLRLALGELFVRPLYGRLTSTFGYRSDPFTGVRRFHYGIDLAAPTGTPIVAAMEGQISYVGEQSRGYGKYLIIRHPAGFQSLYAHLNGFNVRSGQYVSRGQTIGWVGNTGRSTGPHLHFSIIHNGRFVHPVRYLY